METNVQNTKIELIQWLTTLDDTSIIQKIIALRKSQTTDWWLDISEVEKSSIAKGLAEAENNKLKPHSEAQNIYEKWL